MTTMMVPTTAQQILDVGRKAARLRFRHAVAVSNTNYVIAGRIAEIAGGAAGGAVARAHLRRCTWTACCDQDAATAGERPDGLYQHALGPLRPAPLEGSGWMFAAGELAMSPHDLAVWNINMMNRSLLEPASYETMFTNVKLKNGNGTSYGLGVQVTVHDGQPVISHSGEVSGFVAQNTVYPESKVAVTVLTNIDASSAAATIARALAPIVVSSSATVADSSQAEARALKIFTALQQGEIDRQQLTDLCSHYFTPEALADFASSLKPLGSPQSFRQVTNSHAAA